jgi:hypothetical protein
MDYSYRRRGLQDFEVMILGTSWEMSRLRNRCKFMFTLGDWGLVNKKVLGRYIVLHDLIYIFKTF